MLLILIFGSVACENFRAQLLRLKDRRCLALFNHLALTLPSFAKLKFARYLSNY